MTDALPGLDQPLGSLDFRVRWDEPAGDTPFRVAGRRVHVSGQGSGGIDSIWAGDVRVLRDLRVADATVRHLTETPLGVERRLHVGGRAVVERVVAHGDGPVAWIEWAPDPDDSGASAGSEDVGNPDTDSVDGSHDHGALELSLEWRMGLDTPYPVADRGRNADGPPSWDRTDRGVVATRRDPPFAAYVVFGTPPAELAVEPVNGELRVRARATVPDSGLRLALVGAGTHDDDDRLLRMAGRTRVALRGRVGAANRVLDHGLSVSTPDAALDETVRRSILRLDEVGVPASPGPWRTEEAVRAAWALTMVGGHGEARTFLERLGRLARKAGGRVPSRAVGERALEYDDGRAGLLFLLLLGRYLAWSGDLNGVRALWPDAEAVAATCAGFEAGAGAVAGEADLRAAAFSDLAVAAEAIGEDDAAAEFPGEARDASAGVARGAVAALLSDPSDPHDPASTIGHVLGRLLMPDPHAPRGRLELRPRLPESWDRFEVRGLAVGSAAVDVTYRRDGALHSFRVSQLRGPTPLMLVLAPELAGTGAVTTRVDRKPAGLAVETTGDRRRVPVQLVLDHPRTLEVEFANRSP